MEGKYDDSFLIHHTRITIMKKILTISVAAYNVEQYLENTLDSLSDSRYVDKLEVFVVDDGGKDRSLEIAKNFEKQFPQTFHAIHKENGGYGSTVNYSIAHATGKYFKLLDGDDWMDKEGLNKILVKLEQCEDDVVVTDFLTGPSEAELAIVTTKIEDNTVVRVKDHETIYPYGMWALFFKTNILKKSKVKLFEHMLYTDQIYSTVPFLLAETIHFFSIPVYCYRIGREEQSTSKPSRIKHAEEMLCVCDFLYDFYEEHKNGNKYLLSRIASYYILALKTLLLFPLNKDNKMRFVGYELKAKKMHPDIYKEALTRNKWGPILKMLRTTGYSVYPFIKLLYSVYPHIKFPLRKH